MAGTALTSVKGYFSLLGRHRLRLRKWRLGKVYSLGSGTYKVFRETEAVGTTGEAIILIIGFRLRFVRSSRLLHWLFQRICIITTPFWSGLPGFKTKLWMVNPNNHDYLGIYDWRGDAESQAYIAFLLPILRIFSVTDSVWVKRYRGQELNDYLSS